MTTQFNESQVLALIPARGGSKSIPLKNLASLGGKPLLSYVIDGGKSCLAITKIVCSTDHDEIAEYCSSRDVEVFPRPADLSGDDTPVADVMRHVIEKIAQEEGAAPSFIALLQPTSPFLLPEHIEECVKALRGDESADSAQTITQVFHNAHAFNQRVFEGGRVSFRFKKERQLAYNKQRKPHFFLFGNLVVSRARALLSGMDAFGENSLGVEIDRSYALDIDGPDDLDYANYLVDKSLIKLVDAEEL
ncbi:MAG: acylneuraminate cytidylyltransferase family protein [Nitrospinaceae bacterium]|jgi:CMP-N,N'-diacetyllegionaminic acid synthase|nr:acylneuraminate cytidylyltransferase family protein [Nitrospinaceae bacterium]MBT3432939.1 acylneuraminate cytidylyltransferase family protein [Nitrospinaceae bacterium]MBT3822955.1 acylneuraminate cytidylyltransferase family protein [Nitrospinaceae bacterium]MBT4095970.1 acylneuraminate cytidylyltransferase family protein [Nitrospinaceae bacterium]MBT4430144.1 acylneuraminate cytidylyltransferase family protein [Nitrospinaceae bacterium]